MFIKYLKTYKFYFRFIVISTVLTHVVFLIQNFRFFYDSLRFGFGFDYAYGELMDIQNTFSSSQLIFAISTVLLATLNIVIVWEYMALQVAVRKGAISKNDYMFGLGVVLSILGTHCMSCVLVLFGGLVSAGTIAAFPLGGYELPIIGTIILIITNYYAIKKLNTPFVC